MSGSMIGAPLPGPNSPGAQELLDYLTNKDPVVDPLTGQATAQPDRIQREPPEPEEARRRLVDTWASRVRADKTHWKAAHRRMRANGDFVHGRQWKTDTVAGRAENDRDTRYVANIALRHVQQRTASLYATNPEVVARKKERMIATVWDGDMVTMQAAQQQMQQLAMQQAQQAAMGAAPPPVPGVPPPGSENAAAVLADFKAVQSYDKMLDRVCKTLEILWQFQMDEQTFAFKSMMKLTVRRAIVTGVGFVKLGFQRAMKMQPEIETRIADMQERIATIERLTNDLADEQYQRDDAEAEQLRLSIQALMQEPQIIVREGLLFDYPDSTAIIPHKNCKSLRGFLGADWVSQEYMLTTDEIHEVYRVDVGQSYRAHTMDGTGNHVDAATAERSTRGGSADEHRDATRAAVWEIYSRKDGLVYVVCDGYPDFLQEPAAPDVYLDRFYPWFAIVMNEGYHEREIYPPSDIDLIRDMQMELNRARQGLREHRLANRPKVAVAAGMLEEEDKDKLRNHPPNAILELNALAPGQKIEDVLQPVKMPPIDPALYDTTPTFEDILRVLGEDQASMGQTTSATATEAAVAQSAQHTDLASCIDDQDDLLSELATAAGKIMMLNISAETVQRVVGPGAVWPQLSKDDVVENIYLTIRAGSTGRPNKQAEVMNAQILFPMLQRVPGVNPEWMARELIKRIDDRLDVTEAMMAGVPSMDAINRIQGTVAVPPPQDPQNPVTTGQMQAAPGPGGVPVPPAPTPTGGPPPGPPGGPPGAGGPPGGGVPSPPPGAGPTSPPMGGTANDPTVQGENGPRNMPAPPPTNGLLGPRTPPPPGQGIAFPPRRPAGVKTTPQGGVPTP